MVPKKSDLDFGCRAAVAYIPTRILNPARFANDMFPKPKGGGPQRAKKNLTRFH